MTNTPASSVWCFLAVLAGVLAVSFVWSITIDLDRIASALERLAGKERKQ